MNLGAIIKQFINIYKTYGFVKLFIFIAQALNDRYFKKYIGGSFSQKGEDLVIEKFIGDKKKGFYVDIGAHNPNIFNNTKRFYMKGWHGINIEPNPRLIKEFFKQRPRDINLNIGIKNKSGIVTFFEFAPDSLSTFSKKETKENLKLGYRLNQKLQIPVLKLSEVLGKYLVPKIDFISIDTEGLDLEVLESNDWKKFRPTIVCVETGDFPSMITRERKINKKTLIDKYMIKNGYKEYFDNGLNAIYLDKE